MLTAYGVKSKEGGITVPRTVLIDNKGIIKWICLPHQLTDSLFECFLKGADITITRDSVATTNEIKAKPDKKNENIDEIGRSLIRNKLTLYSFSLLKSPASDGTGSSMAFSRGEFEVSNYTLKSILYNLINVSEMQIVIPVPLKDDTFTLFYKNVNCKDSKACKDDIKANLLHSLNLKEKIENRLTEVYLLKVTDINKLEHGSVNDHGSHCGWNDTHLTFSNVNIEILRKQVGDSQKIIILDETNLKGNYDFIIRKNTLEEIQADLESYGLTLEKVSKNIEFYIYE